MSDLVRLEMNDAVAVVTLCRPPANALNRDLMEGLRGLLPALGSPPVRAVLLTGSGRFFSAGLDLFEVFSYEDAEATAFAEIFDDVMTGFFALEVPVVAALNGHAVAGGAVLAATADLRLLAEGDARLGLPEIQVGVPFPTSALEPVRYSFAGPALRELLHLGNSYSPAEALLRNMVDMLVPAAELQRRALALASDLASRPRVAFALPKRALRADGLRRMAEARAHGPDPIWQAWRTPEVRAAMVAFRDRISKRG